MDNLTDEDVRAIQNLAKDEKEWVMCVCVCVCVCVCLFDGYCLHVGVHVYIISRNRPYIGGHLAIYFQIEFKHV